MDEPTSEVRAAYHEAGHAVMVHIKACESETESDLVRVSIEPDEWFVGVVQHNRPAGFVVDSQQSDIDMTAMQHHWHHMWSIKISLAGMVAEALQFGGVWSDYEEGGHSDLINVALSLEYFVGADPDEAERDATVNFMALRARGILANGYRAWPVVDAVAKELLDRRSLSKDEFLAVWYRTFLPAKKGKKRRLPLQPPGLGLPTPTWMRTPK
jgi:hypothetical protein